MAKIQRIKNLLCYNRLSRLKAATGLLSSNDRRIWISTINAPSISSVTTDEVYPWYSFKAIEYIQHKISRSMKVLEYGGGYSTLWWSRNVEAVTTIERSKSWCEELNKALKRLNIKNVQLIQCNNIPEITENELRHNSSNEEIAELIERYISYPDAKKQLYDIVIVDDIFRKEVVASSLNLVKPGGFLILDDSERQEYTPAMEMMENLNWISASFYGTAPYHFHEKQTTIWRKPLE